MTSFQDRLRYAVEDGVATITLDRVEARNAFDQTMAESLLAALKTAERDDAVRVVVITGRGGAFSAGQDVRELWEKEQAAGPSAAGDELRYRFAPILLRIRSIDRPVVAAIDGVATGAGLGIALACDVRIASDRASFVCAPHGIALIPGAGISWMLPRLIGAAAASELLLLGERVDAQRALALGLVHQVVPEAELESATRQLTERLARNPRSSLALTKRAIDRSVFDGFANHLAYEADLQEVAAANDEHQRRLRALVERERDRG